MIRFIVIAMLLVTAANTAAQTVIKNSLSGQEVCNLQHALNRKMGDSARIGILLQLAEYNLEKGGDEKTDLDSAAIFIKYAKEINARRQEPQQCNGLILFYEATLARKNGQLDSARQLAKKASAELQTHHDEFNLARAYLELSCCYDSKEPGQIAAKKNIFNALFQTVPGLILHEQLEKCTLELISFYNLQLRNENHPIKLDFLVHLVHTFRTLNDRVNEFWARKEIADIHYQQGNLNQAISELLEIAKEQREGDFPQICFTYDLLSGLYYHSTDLKTAMYYSLEAVKSVKSATDSAYLPNFYTRVADIYSMTGSDNEAIRWNLRRLNYLIATKQTDNIYSTINGLTADLIRLGKPAEALNMVREKINIVVPATNWEKRSMLLTLTQCYMAVHNKAMTAKYALELINLNELRTKRKEIVYDPGADQTIASFYLDAGEYSKAEKYFKRTLAGWPKSGKGVSEIVINDFLFKLDSAKGNYISAIKHLQRLRRANDSVFTIAKSKQIEQLKITYKMEEKDQVIKLKEQNIRLLTRQDQLQKSQLAQGSIIRNSSFGVVGLLIIVVALLFNRYRLKQRTNRKLEFQQHEIAKQNLSLQHLVNEKDWLVKEIHHRVKNNLHTVMGLLGTQSGYLKNEEARNAITDSQHRIQSMSLIHQRLYQSNNLSAIKMTDYIHELVDSLSDSFNINNRIRFNLEVEPIQLDLAHCIPLGLILNEAITNSFKYAFPNNQPGIISISLKNTSDNHILLTVKDNGIGLAPQFSVSQSVSMGMNLMQGLSGEIGAEFVLSGENGTRIDITFVYEPDTADAIV